MRAGYTQPTEILTAFLCLEPYTQKLEAQRAKCTPDTHARGVSLDQSNKGSTNGNEASDDRTTPSRERGAFQPRPRRSGVRAKLFQYRRTSAAGLTLLDLLWAKKPIGAHGMTGKWPGNRPTMGRPRSRRSSCCRSTAVCHQGLEPRTSRQGPRQVLFCSPHV